MCNTEQEQQHLEQQIRERYLLDTPSIKAALSFIKPHLDAPSYNHVVRSAIFSSIMIRNISQHNNNNNTSSSAAGAGAGATTDGTTNKNDNDNDTPFPTPIDEEVVVMASLLHDMAWNPRLASTRHFVSADKRFEVDGANAARSFLATLPPDHGWSTTSPTGTASAECRRRVQLVWDAIALHCTTSIAWHKEAEVALCDYGILLDVLGMPALPTTTTTSSSTATATATPPFPHVPASCRVSRRQFDDVYAALPSLHLARYMREAFCALCTDKAETTYDNGVAHFGLDYVHGFTMSGHKISEPLRVREMAEEEEDEGSVRR